MVNPEIDAAAMSAMTPDMMSVPADVQTGQAANVWRKVRMVAAPVVAAIAIAGCSGDKGGDQSSTTELDRGAGVSAEVECGDPLELDDYKIEIEKHASSPLTELKEGNKGDIDKIKAEIADELGRNNYALAVADTLIRYNDQPVNFEDIEGNIQTTLQAIEKDEDKRTKVCERVIGTFYTDGEKATVESFEYLEAVPQYKGDELDTGNTPLQDADANGKVEGFWVKRKNGTLPVVWTREGRMLISKTVGDEQNPETLDPNGEPQVSIDENGNEVQTRILPDGTVEVRTKNKDTGEVVVENQGPAPGNANTGGSAGPDGKNPEAGPGGTTNSPAQGGGGGTTGGGGSTTTTPTTSTTTTTRPTTPSSTTTTSTPWKPPVTSCDPNIDDCN